MYVILVYALSILGGVIPVSPTQDLWHTPHPPQKLGGVQFLINPENSNLHFRTPHLMLSLKRYLNQKDESMDESELSSTLNESTESVTADEALKADSKRREIGEKLQVFIKHNFYSFTL